MGQCKQLTNIGAKAAQHRLQRESHRLAKKEYTKLQHIPSNQLHLVPLTCEYRAQFQDVADWRNLC